MTPGWLTEATRETFQLLLAAWGATLATLLAIVDLRARFNDRWKLLAWADATPTRMLIDIVNDGRQPVTITAIEVWYSDDWFIRQLVWSATEQRNLAPSQRWAIDVDRAEVQTEAVARGVRQVYDCRLVVRIKTAARADVTRPIVIDDALVPSTHSMRVHSRVGSDIFLGFNPLPERAAPSPLGLR